MAFESIIEITKTEENAKNRINEAAQNEQKLTAEKKASLEAEYARRISEAEAKAEEILKKAEAEAEEKAKDYLNTLANKNAISAVRGESGFPEGIELIIGKVVNG